MAGAVPGDSGTEIARELQARLRALGWSVSEAARRTDVSRVALSQIVNGRRMPSVATYERLRRGLGLRPSSEALVRPAGPTTFTATPLSRLAA
ncbi:MAG: helix-turn-helix domain-containing protein, partial [Acidimicrobiales bacterium]